MGLPPTGSLRRGGRFCDASPFFVLMTTGHSIEMGCHVCLAVQFLPVFRSGGCWLRKHTGDMALDSRGSVAYFIRVIGLEFP
jgi:hypothetical protein